MRRPATLGWAILVGNVLAYAVIVVLSSQSGRYATPLAEFVASTPPILASAVVGVILTSRRPQNPIGWLFLVNATVVTSTGISSAWAGYALTHPGTLPGGRFAAIWDSAAWPLDWVALIAIVIVFPDGRMPFGRPRATLALAGAALVGVIAAGLLGPAEPADLFKDVAPYGVVSDQLASAVGTAGLLVMIGFCVYAAIVVRRRFRRGGPVRRAQLKWLVLASTLVPATIVTAVLDVVVRGVADPGNATLVVFVALEIALPAAVAIAVLRYRLYDIDRLINRTLVYGALTGVLAATYVGSVLVLQLVLSPSSDLAIAASTLGVAALFRPARAAIQRDVDRRFFRRRYDAQLSLDGFAARLRDDIALDAVGAELCAAVHETVGPGSVTLWLRPR